MAVEQMLTRADTLSSACGAPHTELISSDVFGVTPEPGARYVRLELHDQGGMGLIWRAHDTSLNRAVALKELHPQLVDKPIALARFLREARITGQLEHPGIVPVYDLAHSDEAQHPFYAMRLLKGRTLTQAVKDYHQKRLAGEETALDFAALLHAFVMVCNTIGYAHSRGVIHRDLKGQNVIIGDFGEVVVLDWGLAKLVNNADSAEDDSTVELIAADDPIVTQFGQALGTPGSMAPEQAASRHNEIDHLTDIYGLGALLYEILTGQPPFSAPSTPEILRLVLEAEPAPPRQLCPDIAPGLEAICLRALAKEPKKRHTAAKELSAAVQQWQDAERRQAEEALRASEEKYRSLADLIPGIVWTARADGWIDYANEYWFKFTGLSMAETEGSGWAATVHPDDLPRVTKLWAQSLQSGAPIEVAYRVKQAADGAYHWFLAQAKALRDRDGQIVKWFGMLTEIDHQKRGEKVLERQNELVHLLHQVTVAAYESSTFEEALQAGIDHICRHTSWPVGHVYIVDNDNKERLLPSTIWHLDRPREFESFVQVTDRTTLLRGKGLPGRVLAAQQPVWVMDVTKDRNFPRAKAAANLGVKGAFGFPVMTATGVVAVLEFFTSQPMEPDPVLLEALAQIGLQLGQVFERKRAETELQAARAEVKRARRAKQRPVRLKG